MSSSAPAQPEVAAIGFGFEAVNVDAGCYYGVDELLFTMLANGSSDWKVENVLAY